MGLATISLDAASTSPPSLPLRQPVSMGLGTISLDAASRPSPSPPLRQPVSMGAISLDATSRLAHLEQSVLGQKTALAAAERRLEKANLRYKLYNAEVRRPIQQVTSPACCYD